MAQATGGKREVNLFARPRRFGKPLNLSRLRYFFEDAGEGYTGQMGSYPVINLTLKSAKQECKVISTQFLSGENERKFREIAGGRAGYDDHSGALKFLSTCLCQVTGKNTAILLDEYDVPLENAWVLWGDG